MRQLLFALLLTACAGPNAAVKKTDAVLLVGCSVPSASVYVDESFVGRAAEMGQNGLRVAHGILRVEIRADGYFPAYREVTVTSGGRVRVDVELHALPEGET